MSSSTTQAWLLLRHARSSLASNEFVVTVRLLALVGAINGVSASLPVFLTCHVLGGPVGLVGA